MPLSSDQIKQEILSKSVSEITATFINENFAKKTKLGPNGKYTVIPQRIHVEDKITLKKGEFYNKEDIITTAGRLLFNKVIVQEVFLKHIGYVNTTMTADGIRGLEGEFLTLVLDGRVDVSEFHRYLYSIEWFSMQFNSILGSSFSPNTVKPVPEAMKLKKELIAANKDKLEKGDVLTGVEIESQILKKAKEKLKGDHGMDMYDSGARGSFNASYKPMFSITGPVFNANKGKWDFVESNLNDGISKKDIAPYGNMVVAGAYPKAIGTGKAGYMSKQLTAAYQDAVLDPPGTDCGTTGYVEILFTPWVANQSIYSYIIVNGKPLMITRANKDKFVGKVVKLRSPMYCKSENLCPICAGAIFEKLGIENIGLTVARVSSTILNLSMKKFHATNVKSTKVNPVDLAL